MELIGREALQEDRFWYTLPADKGWEETRAAGIELGMCAVHGGSFGIEEFERLTSQEDMDGLLSQRISMPGGNAEFLIESPDPVGIQPEHRGLP